MKFCEQCDNMYYIGINEKDSNQLTYYCRNCGHKDESITAEGVCVLNTQLKQGEQKFNHIVNQYTKLDPTLPRIYSMKCPNASCTTNHGASASAVESKESGSCEVIYMRYDDDNLKYLYICVTCDTMWKTDDVK
jgi:DNA-directed RNA polymerase subunit M/transcription elongation factor TFIIS